MQTKVEGSTENLKSVTERNFDITGLEDMPRSIIPVPFYTLVQPTSEKVILPNGERAENGTFLMKDLRKTVKELSFVLLRAKRSTRLQKNEYGEVEKVVSLNALAIDLARSRPFILNVPVTSFAAFGIVFEILETKGAKTAWEYVLTATTTIKQEVKLTPRGEKNVEYWVVELNVTDVKLNDKQMELAKNAYIDFAVKLDRNEEEDLSDIAGKVFGDQAEKVN